MILISGNGVDLKGVHAAYGLSLICQPGTHGAAGPQRQHGKVDRATIAFVPKLSFRSIVMPMAKSIDPRCGGMVPQMLPTLCS